MDASTAGGRLKPNLATTKGIEKPSFLLGLIIQILNVRTFSLSFILKFIFFNGNVGVVNH